MPIRFKADLVRIALGESEGAFRTDRTQANARIRRKGGNHAPNCRKKGHGLSHGQDQVQPSLLPRSRWHKPVSERGRNSPTTTLLSSQDS